MSLGRLLRAARIKGWVTNPPVRIDGQLFYIDIAFKQQKLAIEIDGRAGSAFHNVDVARSP